MRLKFIRLIVSFLFFLIVLALVRTQIIKGSKYFSLSQNNSIRVIALEEKRGRIFDRNGVALADNHSSFDVMVIPQEIKDKNRLFGYLSKVLSQDKEKLLKRYRQRMRAPFDPVVIARDVSKEAAIMVEEEKFRFPGLLVKKGYERYYPFSSVNAHILGYVGKINRSRITHLKDYGYNMQSIVGYSGIEEYYDDILSGEAGGLQVEVNNRGEQVRVLGSKAAVNGGDMTLTIDNRIQKIAADLLAGQRGAIIVMDFDNGEILGMASAPSFDPNHFVDGSLEVNALFSDKNAPLINRAVGGRYPPGSVFKIPVAVAALESHKITEHTSFLCEGVYVFGKREFRCSHTHGVQDLIAGIAHSCNIYFFNAGLILGPEIMSRYARMLGLGSLTGVDLPYEAKGLIMEGPQRRSKPTQRFYRGDILNMSIGQGDTLVSPLQLSVMMAAVANEGKIVKPHLIQSIAGEKVVQENVTASGVSISQSTFAVVKKGLEQAVKLESGTAHLLDIEGLSVFGKTGTAQSSGELAHHAWFVGFCPSGKTRIVFCVFLEHGGASYNACMMARNLLIALQQEQIL